jgi:hypothetical protein
MNKLLVLAARLMNPILAAAVSTDKSPDAKRGSTGMRRAAIRMAWVFFLYPASASAIQCASPLTPLDYAYCQDTGLRSMVEEGAQIIQNIWPHLNAEQQQRLGPDQAAWRERTMTACGLRAWSGIIAPETTACLRHEVSARNQMLSDLVAEAPVAPSALHPNATAPDTPAVSPAEGSAYRDGLRDRAAWEQWFSGLQGDYKTGAFFWSSQRSLPKPGPCKQMNDDFDAGCTAAKTKLSAADTRRKSEPSYKVGWNAWAPSEPSAAPSVQNVPPAVAAPVAKGASPGPSNPVYEYKPSTGSNPNVAARTQETTTTTSRTAPTTIEKTPDGQTTKGIGRDGDAIRQHCLGQWPSDFAMRAYCERKQREAVETLGRGRPEDISADDYTIIRGKCATDWPGDFAMRAYCEIKQYEAVRALRQSAETQLQPSFSASPTTPEKLPKTNSSQGAPPTQPSSPAAPSAPLAAQSAEAQARGGTVGAQVPAVAYSEPKTAPTDTFGFKELESIIDASQNNEARFNRDYKGKVFSDVGVLKSVDERGWLIDRNQVHVEAPNGWRTSSSSVYCFPKLDSSETANWPSLMPIKITGTIHDTALGDLWLDDDCQLKPLR